MANPTGLGYSADQFRPLLSAIYESGTVDDLVPRISDLIAKARTECRGSGKDWVDETDVMLITYGDSISDMSRPALEVLNSFLQETVADVISNVHILPCFSWTSDDGFSVTDYRAINPDLGDWSDVTRLTETFGLMLDAVINHISSQSIWFQGFLNNDPKFRDYFHVCDPSLDYSDVTRPRTLPLLTPVNTSVGERHVWTTFSEDQIDLNYANPDVLIEILDLLVFYAIRGARFIRLDAIGFLWKRLGTTCMHLPETHAVIRIMRKVLDEAVPGTIMITETNVPHIDNIGYFGNGANEAHMVYQFPLPPLTLHAFQTGNAEPLSDWAATLEPTSSSTTYLNFLSSHDGIGVRPVEGLLSSGEVAAMARHVEENGGVVSLRKLPDGSTAPYELNITYLDAVTAPGDDDEARARKFLAAQTVLFSVVGVPGIYIHSLLGSRNDYKGLKATSRNRSINRERLMLEDITADIMDRNSLRSMVLDGHRKLLAVRRTRPAFHPNASQHVVKLDRRLFSIVREGCGDRVWAVVNVSDETVVLQTASSRLGVSDDAVLLDLLSGDEVLPDAGHRVIRMPAYSKAWFIEKQRGSCRE